MDSLLAKHTPCTQTNTRTHTLETGEVADVAALDCVSCMELQVCSHTLCTACCVFLLVWRRKPSVTPLLILETQSSAVIGDRPWTPLRLPLRQPQLQSKHQGHVGRVTYFTLFLLCWLCYWDWCNMLHRCDTVNWISCCWDAELWFQKDQWLLAS